jgi:hypothetical protein
MITFTHVHVATVFIIKIDKDGTKELIIAVRGTHPYPLLSVFWSD